MPEIQPSIADQLRDGRRAAVRLREEGRGQEAATVLQGLLRLAPLDPGTHADLAFLIHLAGRPGDAVPLYRRAVELGENTALTFSNLGAALIQLRRPAEAEGALRKALALAPGHDAALRNLGAILRDSGRTEEAGVCFAAALTANPSLEVALQAYFPLSPIALSGDHITAQRQAYAEGLTALAAAERSFPYSGSKQTLPWFYLAYHGLDDRALAVRTAEVLAAKAPTPGETPDLSGWRGPAAEGRRTRVGICSEFLYAHTIGRLYRGLIRHLDRGAFEVVAIHAPGSRADTFRAELDAAADQAVILPSDVAGQKQTIAALGLDVLVFPDLGMSAPSWFLAQSRLAPVQAASWGHPVTTGLSQIDYFLSADGAEPEGAEAAYSERLVRLPRLPTFYETPAPVPAASRAALGLPLTGALYGCPQSLFKFHPDFDGVLARIAEADPTGWLILIGGDRVAWVEALRSRWAKTHPILLERVRFLPRLSHEAFMAHLTAFDLLLDPLHFGSGNNLYEAMAVGTPMVTSPGDFMRGRIVAAAYAQMGLAEPPVAETPAACADLAVALARDPARRAALSADLAEKARASLFEDFRAVRGFEGFLTAAVAAKAEGRLLPTGWRAPEGKALG